MNPVPCFAPEDVERVLASPPGDPHRAHARECPKCGALVAAFELYRDAPGPVTAAEADEAEARLKAFIAREIGAEPEAEPERAAARAAAPRHAPRFSWLQPALAFAGVAIVAAVLLWPRPTAGPAHVMLRGTPSLSAHLALDFARVEAGHFTARWAATAGADRYEVRLYAADLSKLGSLAATDTSLDLDARTLPFMLDPNRKVLVRVVALSEGKEIATSTPQPLERR